MERSTVKLLKKRGQEETDIAKALNRDTRTIKRALKEPADKRYQRPKRCSLVDPFESKINQWLDEGLPVTVMLRKAKEDTEEPYTGG